MLQEVNAQHALHTHRRTPIARFRIMGLDQRTPVAPWHDLFHLFQKLLTPRLLGVPLEPSRHRQCPLPHRFSESLELTLHTDVVEIRGLNQSFPSSFCKLSEQPFGSWRFRSATFSRRRSEIAIANAESIRKSPLAELRLSALDLNLHPALAQTINRLPHAPVACQPVLASKCGLQLPQNRFG